MRVWKKGSRLHGWPKNLSRGGSNSVPKAKKANPKKTGSIIDIVEGFRRALVAHSLKSLPFTTPRFHCLANLKGSIIGRIKRGVLRRLLSLELAEWALNIAVHFSSRGHLRAPCF